jgi:hypothetical protein
MVTICICGLVEGISGVFDIVLAFGWAECLEQAPDRVPQHVAGPCCGLAQQRLEFGEHLLDSVVMLTLQWTFL